MLCHAALRVEFPIMRLNMYGECAGKSRRWRCIPYCLFCFMFDLPCSGIFIHFHTQVGQDELHKDGRLLVESRYVFHLSSHHVTTLVTFAFCLYVLVVRRGDGMSSDGTNTEASTALEKYESPLFLV